MCPQGINFSFAARQNFRTRELIPNLNQPLVNNRRRSFALTNGGLAYASREAEGEYYRANRN